MSNNQIDPNRINNFISTHGAGNCYIGITANITERFVAHGLIDNQGNTTDSRIRWYWGDAGSELNARTLENQFLTNFPTLRGDTGGGVNPHNVYIYLIIPGITTE